MFSLRIERLILRSRQRKRAASVTENPVGGAQPFSLRSADTDVSTMRISVQGQEGVDLHTAVKKPVSQRIGTSQLSGTLSDCKLIFLREKHLTFPFMLDAGFPVINRWHPFSHTRRDLFHFYSLPVSQNTQFLGYHLIRYSRNHQVCVYMWLPL